MKLTEKLVYKSPVNEEDEKAKEVIKELIDTGWSGDNESQMKAVQLLKGLATSDSPEANAFMKKLDQATSGMSESDIEEDASTEIRDRQEYMRELQAKLRDAEDSDEKADIRRKIQAQKNGIKLAQEKIRKAGTPPKFDKKESFDESDIKIKVSDSTMHLINQDKKKELKPILDTLIKNIRAGVTVTKL